MPVEEDIGKAYATYYTHDNAPGRATLPKRLFRQVRASYVRSELGYEKSTSYAGWRWLAPIGALHPGGGDAFAATLMFLPAPSDQATLLDIGCGSGDFLVRMRDLGWSVVGVEMDPVAAERARARGLEVHKGTLESVHLGNDSFDAITMAHVIEHVHDPRRVVEQVRSLLKPQGKLVITTPNSRSWGHRNFGRDWLPLDPPRHLHLFNRDNMRELLRSAGLHPTRLATLAINASAIWPGSAAIRRIRSSPAKAGGSAALKLTFGGVIRQLEERLRLRADDDAGEDLLAIAARNP